MQLHVYHSIYFYTRALYKLIVATLSPRLFYEMTNEVWNTVSNCVWESFLITDMFVYVFV